METCEEQIFPDFEEPLQSCPQAFPVSQLPSPGSEEARQMTVGSGRQCSMLLNESSPLGAFSKILMESLAWTNSEEFVYVWSILDTGVGFGGFQLTPLAQSTEDDGCLLWPTPNSGNFNDGESLETWEARRQKNKAKGINGNGQGTPLAIAAKLWPTPTSRDYKDGENVENVPVNGLLGRAVNPSPSQGSLNPRFVEELMGFPIDHTALKPSETP